VAIGDPRHIQYFANFQINPISFSANERSVLLLQRDGNSTLIADNFAWRSKVTEAFVDREVVLDWDDHQHSVKHRSQVLIDQVRTCLDQQSGPGVVESNWLPGSAISEFAKPQIDFEVELASILGKLRRQKLPDEVALIERCVRAAEAGHARALELIEPGVSDFDVYREVQSTALETLGCPGIVYGDFRATRSERPKAGGLPVCEQLREGDLFILDYSVSLCGYRCDFTNTIAVGQPTDAQQDLFKACAAALECGGEALGPGVACADVARVVSESLRSSGLGELKHHAGHGIGLGHPEPPILGVHSEDVLLEGDVVTIEPGLYVAGVGGIRLEHNYLIDSTGSRQLTNHALALAKR